MADERKRARLSDDGVLMFWEAPTSSDLHALKRDHLQARSDVKTLAEEVRKLSDYEQEHTGSMCWCNDGRETPCYVGTPSDMCLRLNLLLREVDPR